MAASPFLEAVRSAILFMVTNRATEDFTVRQAAILLLIQNAGKDGTYTRDLAVQMQVTAPSITRAVDKLVELNLISRSEDTHDRRQVNLRLTANGETYLKHLEDFALS
jgi:DNA-binding MarR family transcriptional regulator